ncbi:MAG: hypothetical protein ABSH38_14800 [Verrucomicrobiota bacterium]|jgi:hypothetical protein
MSTPLTPLPIRLFCDLAAPQNLLDLNRSAAPYFFRGDDVEIDIGIGQGGSLLTGLASAGAGGIASVTCQLFAAENDSNAPMMSGTVLAANMNLSLTQSEWTNNSAPFYHAAFVFPNSQTGVSLSGQATIGYWLRITAQTTDGTPKTITLLNGPIMVKDGPISTASAPPLAGFRLYSVAGQIVPQLLDTTTGLYHTLAVLNDGGVLTAQLSDQGY